MNRPIVCCYMHEKIHPIVTSDILKGPIVLQVLKWQMLFGGWPIAILSESCPVVTTLVVHDSI